MVLAFDCLFSFSTDRLTRFQGLKRDIVLGMCDSETLKRYIVDPFLDSSGVFRTYGSVPCKCKNVVWPSNESSEFLRLISKCDLRSCLIVLYASIKIL